MKKNNYGFTFIELLVVVTILITVSIYGIFSFLNTQYKTSFRDKVLGINDAIYEFDKKIGDSITDYEATFLNGKTFYLVSENNFYKDYLQEITFSGDNNGTLKTNSTSSGTYKIDIYKNSKFIESKILSATGSQNYNFSSGSFIIKSYLNSQELNTIYILPYLTQSEFGDGETIELSDIYDENSNSYAKVILKNNISKNKQIIGNGNNLDNITLEFTYNELFQTLTIKK